MMNLPTFTKEPELIRATFRINTPMFVAGANQQEAEFTPTAFKGVLRFWWRALNWSKIRLASNDKSSALKALHKQEAKLFGLASKDNKGGQGDCLVNAFSFSGEREWQAPKNQNGVNYLLGQGLYKHGQGLTRRAFADNQSFDIDLTVTQNAKDEILDVLKLIGLLGSFGSRSRHGFGSVTLTSLQTKKLSDDNYQATALNQNATQAIQDLLTKYNCRENTELPPLSAFYSGTRIDVIAYAQNNVVDILNDIGLTQMRYRSYGSKNPKTRVYEVNGNPPERNFTDDHDLILEYIDNQNTSKKHPRRVVFGLPHNYRYSSGQMKKVDATSGRRASPLIQHIHFENNRFYLVNCLLKSEFLHEKDKIKIGNKEVNVNIDYQVIETFMNRFNGERV